MRKIMFILTALLLCMVIFADEPEYVEGRILIQVTADFTSIDFREDGTVITEQEWFNTLSTQYQITKLRKLYVSSNLDFMQRNYACTFPDTVDLDTIITDFINETSNVEQAYKDVYATLCTIPNDEYYEYQWPLEHVNDIAAYDEIDNITLPPGVDPIIVAVIDTGVDHDHPDLNDIILRDNGIAIGFNSILNLEDFFYDDNVHGTLVAGAIAAETNTVDEQGIASLGGYNDLIRIMPIKAFDEDEIGWASHALDGMTWAIEDNGADIINMGFNIINWDIGSQVMHDFIIYWSNGATPEQNIGFVAPAGNDGGSYQPSPACWDEVVGVAATNIDRNRTSYTNIGTWVDISAPGGKISGTVPHSTDAYISTLPQLDPGDPYEGHYSINPDPGDPYYYFHYGAWPEDENYDFTQGTSMSSAMVSSVLSLLKAKYYDQIQNGSKTINDLKDIIYWTADEFEEGYYPGQLGAGIINAGVALSNPHPVLTLEDIIIDDVIIEEGIGEIEWGVESELKVSFKNKWEDATNVQGILEVVDENDITISYGPGNTEATWGIINQFETVSNPEPILLTPSWSDLGEVDFVLHMYQDEMDLGDFQFTLQVIQNVSSPLADLNLSVNEIITTDIISDDIDNDGIDELIMGSSFGVIYIYDYPLIYSLYTNSPISCTPAIGDITGDGYKEIVVGDANGHISIWDRNYNPIPFNSNYINGKILHAVVLEDVTGNGILDIILATGKFGEPGSYYGDAGIHVIDFANDMICSYNSDKIICSPFAVADVDNNFTKEIVVNYQHDYYTGVEAPFFRVFSITPFFTMYLEREVPFRDVDEQAVLTNSPIIVDFSQINNTKEIVFSYYYFHQLWGPTIEVEVYEYISDSWTMDVGFNDDLRTSHMVIGDFHDDTDSFIIFVASNSESLDQSDIQTFYNNGYASVVHNFDLDLVRLLISDINLDGVQELITLSTNSLQIHEKVNLAWFELDDLYVNNELYTFKSFNIGKITENTDISINIITENGYLFYYPMQYSKTSTTEWSQCQNNSRNTGCYYQPLPEEVNDDITLKHDTVIDKNIKILPANTLTIEEGIEIRFEKNKSLNFTGISEAPNPGGLICIGTEEDSIRFGGLCSNETKNYWNGIIFNKMRTSEIEHSIIQNAYTGLSYYDGDIHTLNKNRISNNDIGLSFYNSSFCVNVNEIIDNNYGVSCDKYASPFFGYPGITTPDIGHNGIMYNDIAVYINRATPSFEDGFNDICDNFDLNMLVKEIEEIQINAQRNWWGSNNEQQIIRLLNPHWLVDYDPWCDSPQTIFGNRGDSLTIFQQACVKLYEEQYNEAIVLFQQVIEDSLETIENQISVASLYKCYSILESIFELGNYIDYRLGLQPSEVMENCFMNYKALVNRALGNYNDAIVYYEDILLNNPSYIDSCYAVIDIGNTYLEANGRATGRLMYLQPESFESHLYTTQLLLESIRTGNHIKNNIPQVKKCVLHKNYPNPFNPETTISFSIPEDSKVELSIYNIRGQKVRTLIKNKFEMGFHNVIWNSKDNNGKSVATGVYFYKLKVDGKDISVKKCLLLK